jgi:hypothetical protein
VVQIGIAAGASALSFGAAAFVAVKRERELALEAIGVSHNGPLSGLCLAPTICLVL